MFTLFQKLVKVVTMGEGNIGCGEWNVMVLAGHSLQKWQLYTGDMERLVYEVDLGRPIREAFLDIQIVSYLLRTLLSIDILVITITFMETVT